MQASASVIKARMEIASESDGVALDFKRCRSGDSDLRTPLYNLSPHKTSSILEIKCLKAEICHEEVNV